MDRTPPNTPSGDREDEDRDLDLDVGATPTPPELAGTNPEMQNKEDEADEGDRDAKRAA
jgi:hypothetical protein